MSYKLVCIAGNIGVGKTSLTGPLGASLGFNPYFEKAADNPYLPLFYKDMARWALASQLFFLKERLSQCELMAKKVSMVSDRSIFEDAEVFAQNLFLQGALSRDDWALYQDFYGYIKKQTPPPTLLVYLRASVATLRARISQRGRAYEAQVPESYLAQLNERYDAWYQSYQLGPKLLIDTNGINFVTRQEDLAAILKQCHDAMIA